MRSMTGYGRGEYTLHNRKFVVEIKSVNHRFNELNIRIPKILNGLEDKLRKKLSAAIHRGKTDVFVQFESFSDKDTKVTFNKAICDAYIKAFEEVKNRYALTDEISLNTLLSLPDILSVEKSASDEDGEMWEALDAASQTALEAFLSMRESEGRNLAENIMEKVTGLKRHLSAINERAPLVVKEYEQRLQERLTSNPLLKDVELEQSRLITEVVFFADKACIDEELIRLKSHLSQLNVIFESKEEGTGGMGRRLDFLVQEINREINTIGSKSNDLAINKTVVEMKSEMEKIREQVQNIE